MRADLTLDDRRRVILSIVIVIHVSTSVNGTYSVRPFRMESPMNTCMKGTRIGKWTSGRSVALSMPRRRIYQNHSERKCSVSYPAVSNAGHVGFPALSLNYLNDIITYCLLHIILDSCLTGQ
jgi:hypothetical protein